MRTEHTSIDADAAEFKSAFEHHVQGRLAEADAGYVALLRGVPDHVDGLHFRGVLLHQLGRHDAAKDSIRRAIALDPRQAAAHSNLGVVLLALNQPDEALESFDRALAIQPDGAELLVNRGDALRALNRQSDALESYDRALVAHPGWPDAVARRRQALIALARFEEALADLDHALAQAPDSAGLHSDRGGLLVEMKRYEDAVACLRRALELDPDNVAALSNLGGALVELKRQGEAIGCLDRALALEPRSVNALFNRGTALRDLKRPQEAVRSYETLLAIDPDYAYAPGFLFHSRRQCCDWSDFPSQVRRLEAGVLGARKVDAPFSFLSVSNLPQAQLECARTWAADKCPAAKTPVWEGAAYAHERVRLAYLSADFGEHPVAYCVAELLETHDRAKFEVYGVSFGQDRASAMRGRIERGVDRFIDASGMGERALARLLRELEIDIAVDLNGYTQGNRALVFAQRAAPVQVNYLGYSGTMGAAYFDYIIGDARVIPPGHERFYSEKVVRLPDTYLATDRRRPSAAGAPSREAAGLPAGGFVFCCFNNSYKITPGVFDVWMRLLSGIEGSVLWLYEDNAVAAGNLREQARARGIAAQRLVFARRTPQLSDHLARYRLADLFLDTLPYNAHVTTVDALWSGLPVLTCMGETFAGRVAGSLLHAIDLAELVTGTPAAYEAMALRLASDPARLAGIRARLANNRHTMPLFDSERFRRHLEQAYLTMHERSLQGLAPEGFAVQRLG